MRDRAGFFAGLADVLTALCVYHAVASLFLMSRHGWGVHLGWFMLLGTACAVFFPAFLRRERNASLLAGLTAALAVLSLAVYIAVSTAPMSFGYVVVLAAGAGMTAGLPLYWCLHRPEPHTHLTHLDVLLMSMLVVLLCREAMDIDGLTVAFMTAVLLMDTAAAVGLRMTGPDGSGSEDAGRAAAVALGAAALAAGAVWALTALFSRSGSVTAAVLRGLGRFFRAVGGAVEDFFRWLAALLYRPETYETLTLPEDMPSLAQAELETGGMDLTVNTAVLGAVLTALALGAVVLAAVLLRRRRVRRGTNAAAPASYDTVRRRRLDRRLGRRKEALRLWWLALRQGSRTPAGLLVRLERQAARRHAPRGGGETMRAFIARMDSRGTLTELADALDGEYYGGRGRTLSVRQCRALGKKIRRLERDG